MHESVSSKEHLELAMVYIMQLSLENSRLNGNLQVVKAFFMLGYYLINCILPENSMYF